MLFNKPHGAPQLHERHAPVVCHRHGAQPNLHNPAASLHMHMRRLLTFIAEKEHAEPRTPQHGWHIRLSTNAAPGCALPSELVVQSTGQAIVTQDELHKTYQKY